MKHICKKKLQALYGTNPPFSFVERLDDELSLADRGNISSIYMLLHHLAIRLREGGGKIGLRGTLGSTLISFLLEITDINPLPAHYRCPDCGYTALVCKDSGYELHQDTCPNCDALLRGNGHDIPYEICTELTQGKPIETVDINVSASAWEKAVSFLVEFLGEEQIACACEWNNPVCFMLLPEGMKFEDVTPITDLTPPVCGVRKQTVLPGYELAPTLLRVILLPHDDHDRIQLLHRITKTTPEDIDYSDPSLYKLFQNLDTWGIPGFSTNHSKAILQQLEDVQFSDLVRICGMTCGTNVWENNGGTLLQNHSFRDLISTRDDIYLTLRKHGISSKEAQAVMERVRKGKFRKEIDQNCELTQLLLRAGVPAWYVESMRKIHYLFPKAHAAHYAKMAATLAWFKVHYPKEFYNATQQDLRVEELLHYSN
jgi:DNA polymerase-3 subunit alpha (Gram-positive type)